MRVPYLLACWLVLGCLLVSDEVRDLFLYEHTVGAERIGAALDCLLGSYDNMVAHTPSVLRRRLLALAAVLRVAAALLVRRLVVPVLNNYFSYPLHPLAGAWRVQSSVTYEPYEQRASSGA